MALRFPPTISVVSSSVLLLTGAFLLPTLAGCESLPELAPDGGSGSGSKTGADAGTGSSSGLTDLGNGGADAGSGANGAGAGSGTCAESSGDADQVPSTMLFVIDKSGSMSCNEPSTGDPCSLPQKNNPALPSKWKMTRDALVTTFGDLSALTGLRAGLVQFPVNNFCAVLPEGDLTTEIANLDGAQVTALETSLDAVTPDGQTPLAGAGIRGLEALRQRVVSGQIEGRVFMVLMTDGAETCQTGALAQLIEDVETAREGFGIQTFVIGAPGSEQARSLLSELAFRGGTATSDDCVHGGDTDNIGDCHFDMTQTTDFAADLAAALTAITDTTALTCEFDVPEGAFVDPRKVNVTYEPTDAATETVPQDLSRDCAVDAEGWQFSEDGTQVVLCGDVCDRVKSDPGGKVRVVFGCRETLIR